MGKLAWTAVELIVLAVDIAGMQWYLNKKLESGQPPLKRMLACGISFFLLLAVCYFVSVPKAVQLPFLLAAVIGYALSMYKGKARHAVTLAVASVLIIAISNAYIALLSFLLPGVTFDMILRPTRLRLHALIASKLLFIFLLFLSCNVRSSTVGRAKFWLMVSMLPVINMAMLAVLMYYEATAGRSGDYLLTAVSFGIFAMNVMLLLLHDQLGRKARLLMEKERMLQQAQTENRYFSEAMAAGDSMRGFRHDLKNHLQMLNGLLEMDRVEKAREYLSEIGNFVSSGDILLHSGHPLVDAVLGGKLAVARKLGIELVHTVSLTREIGIEPIDLCSVLGNVMDNAIEACRRIEDGAPKRIEFCLHDAGGDIQLSVVNSMDPGEAGKRRALRPLKARSGHGIGLVNVKKIVQKYYGSLRIEQADGEFRLRIVIPTEKAGN